jgi:SAM-dependent methyltransferase
MEDNVAYNRRYWDRYVERWDDPDFERDRAAPEAAVAPGVIGEEWGTPEAVDEIVERFVLPNVSSGTVAVEIGSGGGRIARRVAPHVGELWCLDVSEQMLARLRTTLAEHRHVHYLLVDEPQLPSALAGRIDFAYSFDVFVHLDLHTQWKYIRAIGRDLRPGGMAFLHTANLVSPSGWQRFAAQPHFTVGGYYFVTPEIVRTMAGKAGLEVVEESDPMSAGGNGYLAQDHCVLLRKT